MAIRRVLCMEQAIAMHNAHMMSNSWVAKLTLKIGTRKHPLASTAIVAQRWTYGKQTSKLRLTHLILVILTKKNATRVSATRMVAILTRTAWATILSLVL